MQKETNEGLQPPTLPHRVILLRQPLQLPQTASPISEVLEDPPRSSGPHLPISEHSLHGPHHQSG